MMLVAAAPASAQGITFGDDDSGRDGERTEQSVETFQFTGADFGDQTITQNVSGDGNETGAINNQQQVSDQTVQNAQADDGSFSLNANGFDNEGDDEENRYYYEDADFDGVADIFDYFVLFGDFDNDGVNDDDESAFASAEAFAFAYSE